MMKSLDQIAAELQGYDPQALPAGKVNEFLAQLVEPVDATDDVALLEAYGRIVAQDVMAPFSVPPHDNSAMDGFAICGAELLAAEPTRFEVIGTAVAGQAWQGVVKPGQCVKIMTGAVMPSGLDTVAPQELCKVTGDLVEIPAGMLQIGDNRRHKGEDLMQGQIALPSGQRLTPAAVGLLASLNIAQLKVYRRLKVAYFSTGDEVLSLGDAPREGAIYDSNRYTVHGLLKSWGIEVIDMGVIRDEPAALEAVFRRAAELADAVVTSGGVSVGEADHTKTIMQQLGDVVFWRIAMRPGRPMAVGRISAKKVIKTADSWEKDCTDCYKNSSKHDLQKSCILFGLPGNPVATMITLLTFVRPALMRMSGELASDTNQPIYLKAQCTEALRKKPGRTEYQRGLVSTSPEGRLQVRCTSRNQGSGVLSSMVAANGLIVLGHDQGNVNPGDWVDVMMFEGVM